jgi:CheY-like chemotaxis protein
MRVLVAEGNEVTLTLLRALLAKRGHQAQCARDGRAALELALRGGFDVMLLDLQVPGLDGLEVVRGIRDRERGTSHRVPILALAARDAADDRERCVAAGVDELLAKPIDAAALWEVIGRLTAERSASPAPRAGEPGLLDRQAILRSCGGDPGVLEALRAAFQRSLPTLVSRLHAAMAGGDLNGVEAAAHKLVGTVGVFSTLAADVASLLEIAATRGDRDGCRVLAERLESFCESLIGATQTLSIDALSS